ncbi:MAG TPA: adenylate/guanylate cyclase domain-containing protein [Acidimicrobiales bacterium]|nr:adenylate/guanylate cyclase domain-containing protein [Acidimicrobiales bacterium]
MPDVPETRYALAGDLHIAYQALGDGPIDLVFVAGFTSHCEHQWLEPALARSLRRMASFSRLIWVDKRGTGLSDPVPVSDPPTLEQRMEDLTAVLDALGSEQAALFGASDGGQMCALFAATYPERVSALALYGTWARLAEAPDYPVGTPREDVEAIVEMGRTGWGQAAVLPILAPSMADDERFRSWWAQWERLSASPGMAAALLRVAFEGDTRGVLSSITAPTLVMHRKGDRFIDVEHGRYLADHLPGARYVELEGDDHPHFVGDTESVMDELEEFLTGCRGHREPDRMLATVLFTDIVGSTERAAAIGDRRWRDLLEAHHSVVRGELDRFHGQEIDTAGDGFLAAFDGPARAIRCAEEITAAVRRLGLEVRAGVHTGEVERREGGIGGIAVHIGARVAALAGPGEVLVSRTVKDLVVGSGIRFEERGTHQLKGVPDQWQLFAVTR